MSRVKEIPLSFLLPSVKRGEIWVTRESINMYANMSAILGLVPTRHRVVVHHQAAAVVVRVAIVVVQIPVVVRIHVAAQIHVVVIAVVLQEDVAEGDMEGTGTEMEGVASLHFILNLMAH